MLDKYDEEEDTGMDIDESGAFSSEKARQQAEIRAKLAAGERVPLMLAVRLRCCPWQSYTCCAPRVDQLPAASRLSKV